MSIPLHLVASVPLAEPAATVHDRLVADAEGAVTAATADALEAMAGVAGRWGAAPTELPKLTVGGSGGDGPGVLSVRWHGPEARTGWPAIDGRLLVVAGPAGGSRLTLATPRTPRPGLTTTHAAMIHRRRAFDAVLRRFLLDLACRTGRPTVLDATLSRPTSAAVPRFVHRLRPVAADPDAITAGLRADLHGAATRATQVALARAADQLAAGRFRTAADPIVTSHLAERGEVAVARVGWRGDEEASGWPTLDLDLIVEAHGDGARVVALSATEPGYDLSRSRVDKLQRDHLRRFAGADLVEVMCDEVAAALGPAGRVEADPETPATRQPDRAPT